MRFLFTLSVVLFLSACANQHKTQKEFPMTCARQTAMFEAGYRYYWSGDRLAIISDNGDHYTLSEDETEAQFMFDRCSMSLNNNDSGGYDYGGYENGYNNGNGHNRWKTHRRNSRDRNKIRQRNNEREDGYNLDDGYDRR